ncbi:MerR family transcriptional regulator [Paucidesulfovibrio longus]|uniref:MerR family transcriptional regulator n=1 Tax=Paucidesulfovibrio longus TaxID=889 RepID=UPI0003B65052|nr:MerR family transcriptional regulator [Paucidesulfovibrio longus]
MNDLGKFKRYRIGEAAQELGVKTSVLRFWESQFEQLVPVRTASGQRLYTEEHLGLLRLIKSLLYDEGLTLEGARKRLEEGEPRADGVSPPGPVQMPQPRESLLLREAASELRAILALMRRPERE